MLDGLPDLVRRYRAAHRYSRKALAEASGAGERTIASLEGGDPVDWATVEKLAATMGLADLHDLARALDEVNGRTPPPSQRPTPASPEQVEIVRMGPTTPVAAPAVLDALTEFIRQTVDSRLAAANPSLAPPTRRDPNP